jgi:hypothetical protein
MNAKDLTDEIFQIINSNTSGKVSDLITTINNVESHLKKTLDSEYLKGFEDGKKAVNQKRINKQIKEN